MLGRTRDSSLDCKEIKPINPKEINLEYSLEGLMLKLKLQHFDHLMWRVNSMVKNPDAGKDWRQEEKGAAEDEMVRQRQRLNGKDPDARNDWGQEEMREPEDEMIG